LQQAKVIPKPTPCEMGPKLTKIVEAAGDRIKVFGDVLDYANFFQSDDAVSIDATALDKRLREPPDAASLLKKFRAELAEVEPFDSAALEAALQGFVARQGIQNSEIIHSLRLATTGKSVGFGLFETLALLGRNSVLARIDRVLGMV
jgi:glutamyl-tRNA synthetase